MTQTLKIRSAKTVLPDGVRPATVVVDGGKIAEVAPYEDYAPVGADVDLGEVALLPGLVDAHAHVGGPDGFTAATSAAAAGGITTICDMPSGPAPATSASALRARIGAASGRCHVDVAFWGGAVPGNTGQLAALAAEGVAGFKCFLADPGIPGLDPLDRAGLRAAMAQAADTDLPMVVHAEDPDELASLSGWSYDSFVASRPPVAERRAIEAVVSAAAATGARAHIARFSAAECAALIGAARAAGIALSAGTCPHYLTFAAEEVPDDAVREFRCYPPIRYAPNREALWRALAEGVIDCVASGHSQITSPRIALPAVWTVARERGHTLADIARWMSAYPARLAGLPAKGAIAAGRDADLVAFDPGAPLPALAADGVSPAYAGRRLAGAVTRVWLRGTEILNSGPPNGSLLLRRPHDRPR